MPVQMDDRGASGIDERFLANQASQRFGADLQAQQKGKLRSGDDDLSARIPLSQRRAKFDSVKAKQAARSVDASCKHQNSSSKPSSSMRLGFWKERAAGTMLYIAHIASLYFMACKLDS